MNNSKPLPSGLVTELLPEISAPISPRLSQRKLPSALVDQLNQAEESPLKGLIRRPSMSTSERKAAVITDTSLVKGLEEALRTPASCLFPYRNIASGETDIDGIWAVLICYWSAVRDVFPDVGATAGQGSTDAWRRNTVNVPVDGQRDGNDRPERRILG